MTTLSAPHSHPPMHPLVPRGAYAGDYDDDVQLVVTTNNNDIAASDVVQFDVTVE